MNIFIYSDESGVFDKFHNDLFVFGGVMFFSTDEKDEWSRRYAAAEKVVRNAEGFGYRGEIKASNISNKSKSKLYRSLNNAEKFGVVVHQTQLMDNIFKSKKVKQRYLDFAYRTAVKTALKSLIERGVIDPSRVEGIHFFVDDHTTATDNRYELNEALEQELKYGTYNYTFEKFYPPLFPDVKAVDLRLCNSDSVTLVRAADIVANKLLFKAMDGAIDELDGEKFHVIELPKNNPLSLPARYRPAPLYYYSTM